jgi:hypothetical protein
MGCRPKACSGGADSPHPCNYLVYGKAGAGSTVSLVLSGFLLDVVDDEDGLGDFFFLF